MPEATLNVRLDSTLKQHGADVLKKEGVTVTQAVRALYEYMEANQALPPELKSDSSQACSQSERRRSIMRSLIGILPQDASLEQAREARLARHGL